MAILDPDATLIGTIRSYPAAWRERVSQILQAIQTKFTDDETERLLSNNLIDGWNGSIIGAPALAVSSNGSVWTASLSGGVLGCIFGGVSYDFDTTTPQTLALTTGTDAAPQINYIYLTLSGSTVSLAKSTSGWPSEAFCHIGTTLLQSLATGQTYGPMKMHAWTDHLEDDYIGHVSHLSRWIRQRPAQYGSGVAPTFTITAPAVYIEATAGVIGQLHFHTMPAFAMGSGPGDPIFVTNDPNTTISDPVFDLDELTVTADNVGFNNKHGPLVLWAQVSEAEADCKYFLNLPDKSYNTQAQALEDVDDAANATIPNDYEGVGFLIAKFTVEFKTSGTWVLHETIDLRGDFPTSSPSGGTGPTSHATLADLTVAPDAGHTQLLPRSIYDANSVVVAVSDDTPVVQAVAASEFVGRKATGDVGAMSAAEAAAVLTSLLLLDGTRTMTGNLAISNAQPKVALTDTDGPYVGSMVMAGKDLFFQVTDVATNNFRFSGAASVDLVGDLLVRKGGVWNIVPHAGKTNIASQGWFLDEDDMASDDATKAPSQQSVKAFVDNRLSAADATDLTDGGATTLHSHADDAVGFVPIETHELAASGTDVASVLFDWTGEGYNSYLIEGTIVPATDGALLYGRVDDGGSIQSGAADYGWACRRYPVGTGTAEEGDASDSELQLTGISGVSSAANEGVFFRIHISGTTTENMFPFIQFYANWVENSGSAFHSFTLGGGSYRTGVTALEGFQLSFSSGNVEAVHATLYGLATA